MNLRSNFHYQDFTAINFVHLKNKEIEMVRQWRNNRKIRKWMFQDHLIDPEEHQQFLKKLFNNNSSFYWLVRNNLNQYFGVIYLKCVDSKNKIADLGIYKNPKKDKFLVGKGRLLIDILFNIAFEKMKLKTLELEVFNDNERALSFYKKSGFKRESMKKNYLYRNSVWHDIIQMSLVNNRKI